jgi:hypothetical protein
MAQLVSVAVLLGFTVSPSIPLQEMEQHDKIAAKRRVQQRWRDCRGG